MKDLKSIIKSLSSKEVKFITDYYKNNEDKKRLSLFRGVLSGKFKTDEDAALKLYGKKGSAYSHLKTRHKDDLLNLLLFFSKDIEHQSAVLQAELDVDRMILQAKMLHRRKVTDTAIKLLKTAYELCIKYELIKEKVIVSFWYSGMTGNKYGLKSYDKINFNLNNDVDLLKGYLTSYNQRYRLSLYGKFSKENNDEHIKLAYKSYINIKEIFKKSDSKNIANNYYITAIGYFSLMKDYTKVYQLAKDLNKLILNNMEIKGITQEVNSYLQLFNAAIHLLKYNEATNYAIESYQVISNSRLRGSGNELIVLEYIFLSNLREKDSSMLKLHLSNGINHPQINSSIQIEEKWIFFTAAFYFRTNIFDKTLQSLYQISNLLQDKSGWLFTFKLLEIMCYIEQEEFDMVNYRIETFRKLLSKKDNENIERIKTIHQVLKSLLKFGFNFKKVVKDQKGNLVLLQEAKDEYYWDPLGFEIIRFDEWFFSKVKS